LLLVLRMTRLIQLWIPGTKPAWANPFSDSEQCGDFFIESEQDIVSSGLHCRQSAGLVAVYFRMGNLNKGDGFPGLEGYDCPFEDSDQLYACCPSHLVELARQVRDSGDWGLDACLPEIVVNASGEIEKDVFKYLCAKLDEPLADDFFKADIYSHGRETITAFWERSKHIFGF